MDINSRENAALLDLIYKPQDQPELPQTEPNVPQPHDAAPANQ